MSDKFIRVIFKNAKLFPKNTKTKDVVTNITTNKDNLIIRHSKRADNEITSFKEAITVHQISNMMHTLVGERPIPSFRKTFYQRDEKIFDLAMKSFLRITSPKIKKGTGDLMHEVFIPESTRLGKSPYNSYVVPNSIQWFKVKKIMGEHFDEFISIIKKGLNYNVLEEPFENLIYSYSKFGSKLDETIAFLKKTNKTPIANFLSNKNFKRSEITQNQRLGETVCFGVDSAVFLSGEILIPYDQSFVDRIIRNCTNMLDGGYVKIIGTVYGDELDSVDGLISVVEISDEKY
jgi:hypothetical protein